MSSRDPGMDKDILDIQEGVVKYAREGLNSLISESLRHYSNVAGQSEMVGREGRD